MGTAVVDESLRSATLEDVIAGAERIKGRAVVTPVLASDEIDAMLGGRLLFKVEALQRTGSYKFRGAYNRLSLLDAGERERGVVAFSTGNFGQAVAAAAKMLGVQATIVIPGDAPAIKVANTRAYGAEVVFYDRARPNHREEIAAALSREKGLTVVPPGDDPHVIAGYGTTGLELVQQCGGEIDALLCPCGGGGLSAGIVTAFGDRPIEAYTVEPEHFDDMARSLRAGKRVGNDPGAGYRSICDAILTPMPAELPFRTLRSRITAGLVVTDEETERAMAVAFRHLKLVLEPAGAIALAAALSRQLDCKGKTVAVICSGGSVDPALFARAITR